MLGAFVWTVIFVFLPQGLGVDQEIWKQIQSSKIEEQVTFRLFTRANLHDGVIITPGNKTQLAKSGFKGSLPTLICSHGYFDSENASWVKSIKQGVLKNEEANFITLDYSTMAHNLLYNKVVSFAKEAGLYTGQLLKFLQKEGNFKLEKAHLIGHSLGAQIVGFAGKAFPVKKTLGRITALDPAAPLFEHAPELDRLNPDLAKLVDVIHTCTFIVGMKKPVGTIDFYPNGGFHQPGCSDLDLRCHHARSREYFYETLVKTNPNKYIAKKCEKLENAFNGSCYGVSAAMGYYLNFSSPGIYYLKIK